MRAPMSDARPAYRDLGRPAPTGVEGSYTDGYAPLANAFAESLQRGEEIGAGLTVYHRGRCVVDLWGGHARLSPRTPWTRDTRAVVFSVTKGLAAMALHLLADRGRLHWDAPVCDVWPAFAAAGKEGVTHRVLFNHRAGLPALDEPFTLDEFTRDENLPRIDDALARAVPRWSPGADQGYHATTYGMYLDAVFRRVAGERVGRFLQRELFDPLGADVSLGTPASEDDRTAALFALSNAARIGHMLASLLRGDNTEARLLRDIASPGSLSRAAFLSPRIGREGVRAYNRPEVRRACLPWASATGTAHGVARAYLPFAQGGEHDGRRYLREETLSPIYSRQGWSPRDRVLHKALGWSQGFLKEEEGVFSPARESFGHSGIGGSLGWCDPVRQITFGYVMNRLDWRVRSPRCLALCAALYRCEAVREAR